jgi:formylmethanofuran dehydrogenase subunit E
MEPNKAFRQKKRNQGSISGRLKVLIIRCSQCNWTMTVSRTVWLGDNDIVCRNCDAKDYWNVA